MRKKYYSLLVGLIVIYLAAMFLTPIRQEVLDLYKINELQLRLVQMAIVVPLFMIYFLAFYGFITMKEYTSHIKGESDGNGLGTIANGLAVLAVGMVISGVITSMVSGLASNDLDLVPTSVIIGNYMTVILSVTTYLLLYRGSKTLKKLVPADRKTPTKFLVLAFLYPVFSVGFTVLALNNPDSRADATATSHGLYYLPDWLIFVSVVLPLLTAWGLGLAAAYNISYYRRKVNGVIYRDLLKNLAVGVSIIIFASAGAQVLGLFPRSFANLSLSGILVVIAILLGIIAAGFVMVALGAKKLRQLEGL